MGNLCSQTRKDDQILQKSQKVSKNLQLCQFSINEWCKLALILGSYRSHKADLLLVFTQQQFLEYCSEIKDYALDYLEMIELATQQKKKLFFVHTNKSCPYKKLVVAVMSPYNSQQAQAYFQEFKHIISEVLIECSEFTLQLNITLQNGNGVPNQTLISLFIKHLRTHTKSIKIYLISAEMRLLNMVRYEMAKLGTYIPLRNKYRYQ